MKNMSCMINDYGHSIPITDIMPGYVPSDAPWTAIKVLKQEIKELKKKMIDKVFLVIYTDGWQVDYITREVWTDKNKADERAKELTEKEYPNNKNYWYEVKEIELNKKTEAL